MPVLKVVGNFSILDCGDGLEALASKTASLFRMLGWCLVRPLDYRLLALRHSTNYLVSVMIQLAPAFFSSSLSASFSLLSSTSTPALAVSALQWRSLPVHHDMAPIPPVHAHLFVCAVGCDMNGPTIGRPHLLALLRAPK